ncbi:MAG: GldG family protein [Limisphaerales bacterium]
MNDPLPPPVSFSPPRQLRIGASVAVSLLALAAVVLMTNYLAARHYQRFLWTSDARYELSTQTRQLLAGVTVDFRVTILFDRNEPLFDTVSGLLKEYAYACPRITVEHVDYQRDLGRAETVIARYQLSQTDIDLVVFDAGGRTKIVRSSELSDYNLQDLFAGEREVKRIAFRGEPLFTSAIAGLLDTKSPVAYFLRGHGEHDPSSDEARMGYAKFGRVLQQKNITVSSLFLAGTNTIPEDCALLVVAGPENPYGPTELEQIDNYLGQGGRMLALLSYHRSNYRPTGLEGLLSDWGVAVGANLALDPATTKTGLDLICTNIGNHQIVKPLADKSFYLWLARSVEARATASQAADTPRVTPLFATSVQGYTASDVSLEGVPRTNPQRDRRGTIPLAVAMEKGSLQGVSADRGSTRLVAVGESIFLGNQTIENLANLEFASHAINWLLDRPQSLAGIAPRPIEEYRITLTRSQLSQSRLILLGLLPGIVLAVGGLVWMRRRR